MPFVSQAQAGWAFANKKPFAKRWARQTGPYKRLPYKKRHKALTLAQLEAFVCSPHYDPDTADAIAARIPELAAEKAAPSVVAAATAPAKPAAGGKGESLGPGITRIRGNLCNVHGRYGRCPGAGSAPASTVGLHRRKPRKGAKPKKAVQTPAQRAQARQQQHDQNAADVATQMAKNDTGLSPSGSKALLAFANGVQPDAAMGDQLTKMGLAERNTDGSYRMTGTAHGVISAMRAGDYQRAVDGVARGVEHASARQQRETAHTARQTATAARQQAAAAKRQAAQAKREQAAAARAKRQARSSGGKTPAAPKAPRAARAPRAAHRRGSTASIGASPSVTSGPAPKKPAAPKPPKAAPAPVKQLAPALTTAAQSLSDGKQVSDADAMALLRNGLAHLVKGELVLTAAGRTATMKAAPGDDMDVWMAEWASLAAT